MRIGILTLSLALAWGAQISQAAGKYELSNMTGKGRSCAYLNSGKRIVYKNYRIKDTHRHDLIFRRDDAEMKAPKMFDLDFMRDREPNSKTVLGKCAYRFNIRDTEGERFHLILGQHNEIYHWRNPAGSYSSHASMSIREIGDADSYRETNLETLKTGKYDHQFLLPDGGFKTSCANSHDIEIALYVALASELDRDTSSSVVVKDLSRLRATILPCDSE